MFGGIKLREFRVKTAEIGVKTTFITVRAPSGGWNLELVSGID